MCTTEGQIVMQGSDRRRSGAKYKADRALFLLLLWAPYRSTRLNKPRVTITLAGRAPPANPLRAFEDRSRCALYARQCSNSGSVRPSPLTPDR